jgi:hypothetical protein
MAKARRRPWSHREDPPDWSRRPTDVMSVLSASRRIRRVEVTEEMIHRYMNPEPETDAEIVARIGRAFEREARRAERKYGFDPPETPWWDPFMVAELEEERRWKARVADGSYG